jgi:hypothetical protein
VTRVDPVSDESRWRAPSPGGRGLRQRNCPESPRPRRRAFSLSSVGEHAAGRLPVAFLLFALLTTGNAADIASPSLEYLYIDSSEGTSSGGHAAIRFGDEIFHFQHFEPGVLRSVKDNPHYFRYLYGFLENRTIHASRIDVSDETWRMLRDYFNHRYLIQKQQFDILQSLRDDQTLIRLLLRRMGGGERLSAAVVDDADSIRLPAVGLFFPDHIAPSNHLSTEQVPVAPPAAGTSPVLQALRERIEQRYGRRFLAVRMEAIRERLRRLKPTGYDRARLALSEDRFPTVGYAFAQQYKDRMTALMGLKALQLALPLRSDVFAAPRLEAFRLEAREIERLARYRQQLETDLVRLANSRRPDWGVAFLAGMARLIVLDQAVRSGRLVFLDTFQRDDDRIAVEDIVRFGDVMREQLDDVEVKLREAKVDLLASQAITEADYSRLEHWSNRFLELHRGIEQQRPIRIHSGDLLPTKITARSDLIVPETSQGELNQKLAETESFQLSYFQQLKRLYRYNLFTKNCVSEIFRTIHGAFESRLGSNDAVGKAGKEPGESRRARVEAESVARLGGYLGAEGIHLIPFVSAYAVDQSYDVVASEEWPSYRKAALRRAYEDDAPVLVYLRESNVISATLYRRNPDDSFFIFFTDDALLPRPLFGAVNSVAGLGQSIVGLFLAPFDGGRVLSSGAKGFLFSLPELLFFNIRKGSYRYLPYGRAVEGG